MKRLITGLFIFLIGVAAAHAASGSLMFAATEMPKPDPCLPFIGQTSSWLNENFSGRVKFEYYERKELEKAIRDGKVDIILSEAGEAARLRKWGTRPLLTAVSIRHPNPQRGQGSVFFVRNDRKDLSELKDLRNLKLAATDDNDFTGFHAGMGELIHRGFNPDKFFSHIQFIGSSSKVAMHHVVDDVISGKADVGIVRTCFLEDLEKLSGQAYPVKVIGEKPKDSFACKRSTDLYPNWTISSTKNLSSEDLRDVTKFLLEMPKTSDGKYWSLAPDLSNVENLMKELKIGEYDFLRHWSLKQVWAEYKTFILLIPFVILNLIWFSWRSSKLVEKRTNQLRKSFKEREQIREKAEKIKGELEQFQKASIVGQMSNIFAHEVKQPLHALYCYAQGKESEKENVDLNLLLQKICTSLKRKHKLLLRLPEGNFFITANPLEIQLIFTNILKNAVEASEKNDNPEVSVEVNHVSEGPSHHYVVTVSDNGPKLTEAEFNEIGLPLVTSKKNGLGLGINIVKTLLLKYGGNLKFIQKEPAGIKSVITLPITQNNEEKQ